jgi:3-dehydroquinate synthase
MICTVKTSIPVAYSIRTVSNVLSLTEIDSTRKIVVVDSTVYALYANSIGDALILSIDCSEETKNWEAVHKILAFLELCKVLRRSEPVIAIGGGVLLDVVGFCCSIYRRGIPYVRIPTTLLAIVDASVGAKTSINDFGRRNRIGSFYPPIDTLIDPSFIITQDSREISNGVAEIIKLAIVTNHELFELLESDPVSLLINKFQHSATADRIVNLAIIGMAAELNDNLWETNLQRPVDFGHTFSPVIEMKNVTDMLHGEAVILDCLLSSCIAAGRGLITNAELKRIFMLVHKFNLPTMHPDFMDTELLTIGLCDVMTHRNNNQYLPLPSSIGKCVIVNDVLTNEIVQAINLMRNNQL